MQRKLCIVPPPNLQGLMVASGLIRWVSGTCAVCVATRVDFLKSLPHLFHGINVRFWFTDDPENHAHMMGYNIAMLPQDPSRMYEAFDLASSVRYAKGNFKRDLDREARVLDDVVDQYGSTFTVVWSRDDAGGCRCIDATYLPEGVPVVDATSLDLEDPFDYCGLMEHAMQVHAVDGWFLTLADLVGGGCRVYCHAYAGPTSARHCREKYRKRVTVLDQPP